MIAVLNEAEMVREAESSRRCGLQIRMGRRRKLSEDESVSRDCDVATSMPAQLLGTNHSSLMGRMLEGVAHDVFR